MKRLISLTALFVLLSCGAAIADFAYMTEGGTLGCVSVESSEKISVTPGVASGLGNGLLSAWNKGSGKVAVIRSGGTDGWDRATVYTSGSWTEPKTVTLTGVSGASGVSVSRNGNSIFVASENNGRIVEFTLDSYELTGRSFDCAAVYGGSPLAKDVVVHGDVIYGLFSFEPLESRGKLVLMDGLLDVGTMYSSFDVGSDSTCIADASNGYLGIARGGQSGGLDILAKSKVTSVFSGDVPAVRGDSDEGLYFIAQKSVGGTASNTLYHYKSSKVEELSFTGTGTDAGLSWDNEEKLLAMMTGDGIRIIDRDGNLVKLLSASELGGTPVSVAFLPKSSNRDDGSNDNGCSALTGGVLLLPLALISGYRLGRRRK